MSPQPLRVLVVDDSRIFRSALEDALRDRPEAKVVGSVWSGEKAMEFLRTSPPDLVTLDLNMPGRGGLDTLSDIRQWNLAHPEHPAVGVLLVSALTERGAAVTVEGLSRGAFDFIRKPEGPDERANAASLQRQLLEKIELFSQQRRRVASGSGTSQAAVKRPPARPDVGPYPSPKGRYQAIAIASSTGGVEALATILPELTRSTNVPVLIVQHIKEGMTRYLAESLDKRCPCPVVEATDGEVVRPGTVYIAASGRHMVARRQGSQVTLAQNDLPPENGCRPSADVLFRSVAEAYPKAAVAIVLTGMQDDGAKGLGPLKRAGAYIIAQDEATSVVWGMPGAAVATGLVDEVLPLGEIARAVAAMAGAGASP